MYDKLARRHAEAITPVIPGVPLARMTPSLGWQKVRMRGRVDVESELTNETKKKRVLWGARRFISWMEREGARFAGSVEVQGPFPHADLQEPATQKGENGASRPVARTIESAISNNGKEDYVIHADFWVREQIQEIDTDVALEVMGARGLRPARPKEWQWLTHQS